MPRSSICSATWILTFLLLDLAVTENKKQPKQDISSSDLREKRLLHDYSKSFRGRKLLRKNNSIETVDLGLSNKTSRIENGRIVRDTDVGREYNDVKSANERTLMDYNGPVIIDDFDDRSNRDFATHVRVKRSESMNDSTVSRHRSQRSNLDNFPINLRNDAISTLGELISKFQESNMDSNQRNESDVIDETVGMHSRRKREILHENDRHRKRVKGNAKRSKYIRVENKIKNKKRGTLKKVKRPGKKSKRTAIDVPDESRIQSDCNLEKKESEDNSLADIIEGEETKASIDEKTHVSTSTNDKSLGEQSGGNTIVLPFVHSGKAEVRVRIEKIPTNVSSFNNFNGRTDRLSAEIESPPAKYGIIGEITNINITKCDPASAIIPDSAGKKEANNSTVEITLKKLDCANDNFRREASDFGNTLTERDIRNSENREYDCTNKIIAGSRVNEDARSFARGNQIMSKRYARSNTDAMKSKRFGNSGQRTSIESTKKHERAKRTRNRAGRSIEEIKELAERLIIKVNELQMYVSNYSKTLHRTDAFVDKNANCTGVPEETSENPSSKIARNTDYCRKLAKSNERVKSVEKKRAFSHPLSSEASRFAREGYRNGKKLRRKWGRWTDWSSCSVTCGKGRQIRWRYCLRDCQDAETEMEEKACQLPACPPGKFLGLF